MIEHDLELESKNDHSLLAHWTADAGLDMTIDNLWSRDGFGTAFVHLTAAQVKLLADFLAGQNVQQSDTSANPKE